MGARFLLGRHIQAAIGDHNLRIGALVLGACLCDEVEGARALNQATEGHTALVQIVRFRYSFDDTKAGNDAWVSGR